MNRETWHVYYKGTRELACVFQCGAGDYGEWLQMITWLLGNRFTNYLVERQP